MEYEVHSSNGKRDGNGNGKHKVNGKNIQERDNREKEMISSQMAGNSGTMKPKPVSNTM